MFTINCKDAHAKSNIYIIQDVLEIAGTHEYLPLKHIDWSQRWCMLPFTFKECFEKFSNFEIRQDDVFLGGFTKTGTTWMQEILWLLVNQLNFQRAEQEDIMQRTTLLDMSGFIFEKSVEAIEMCNSLPSPRVFKSHLPVNLLPKQLWQKKTKFVYIARNVKDVVVSSYNFYRDLGAIQGSLDEYVQGFISDKVFYGPYWQHVIDFWQLRHEPHIFFVTYEELRFDLKGVLQKLCDFLERPQLTDIEMTKMLKHLSFEHMKSNKNANCDEFFRSLLPTFIDKNFRFMRRGQVGSYKDELSAATQQILNEWSIKCLAKHGLKEEDIFGNI